MQRETYTVVGYGKGISKKSGKPFTNVALQFESPFDNFNGYDVEKVFISGDINVELGMEVYIEYGRDFNGKAVARNLIPVE